jgi:hypothetical protein
MTILNYDGKSNENIIQIGEGLIQGLRKYQNFLTEKTHNAFTSFTIEFDPEIERRVANMH